MHQMDRSLKHQHHQRDRSHLLENRKKLPCLRWKSSTTSSSSFTLVSATVSSLSLFILVCLSACIIGVCDGNDRTPRLLQLPANVAVGGHQLQSISTAEQVVNPKNYTDHSVVKILGRNIHMLFENGTNDNLHEHEHEILWYDNSNRNSSFAFVRLNPHVSRRVRRDTRKAGNPIFLTNNLQSWIEAEHQQQPQHYRTTAPHQTRSNYLHRSPSSYETYDFIAESENEDDSVGTTFRGAGDPKNPRSLDSASSVVDETRNSRLLPSFALNHYHPLATVHKYIEDLESRGTPGVTVFTIGYSHENRPIKAIEVLNNPADNRFIWIDACTHAREWVTVTTALYIIEQVIVTKIPLNFVIVPVLNVDGYAYTWTRDRMWRKNRRQYSGSRLAEHAIPDRCNGVDLNRNYDINFSGEGSSTNPCSNLYQGPHPFSEPEVKAASDLLSKNRHRIKMTLSLHSFNQLWASPNAFTRARTPDHAHHMRVLSAVQRAVAATNGVKYDVGPLGTSLYLGSGFMMDWIYHKLGIRDAYLVELRDKGFYGFILPADQIWPTATETWAGLRAAFRQIFSI